MRTLKRMIEGRYGKRKAKNAQPLREVGSFKAFGQTIYSCIPIGKKDGIPTAYGITVKPRKTV